MPELEPVDLVLTDPPYGVGKADWDSKFFIEPLYGIDNQTSILGLMPGIWNILRCPQKFGLLEYKWILIAHLINGMSRGAIGFGNYIPLLIYAKPDISVYKKDSDIRDIVIESFKPDHPSPKPINAMRYFITRLNGDTILDPFMGSGATLVAAKQLGRKAIGIEIEERYVKIAIQRLAQEELF